MATIHQTTMTPTKIELITPWIAQQPWYAGTDEPALKKSGGFRLDDPDGEVGIEFLFLTDTSAEPTTYHLPLTYRGAPSDDLAEHLIGTAEHGVLGTRWIYDGVNDPALLAQVGALVGGGVRAQAQNLSDTPDPSVTVSGAAVPRDGGAPFQFVRVLDAATTPTAPGAAYVQAEWHRDDEVVRSVVVTVV
jgi:hypothetical protein